MMDPAAWSSMLSRRGMRAFMMKNAVQLVAKMCIRDRQYAEGVYQVFLPQSQPGFFHQHIVNIQGSEDVYKRQVP